MVDFVNRLEFSDKKYKTDGTVRDENYNKKLLFTMKYFVLFGTDFQSMFVVSTIFSKDNIYGVHSPQFKLNYIFNIKKSSHRKLVIFCCDVHYMW